MKKIVGILFFSVLCLSLFSTACREKESGESSVGIAKLSGLKIKFGGVSFAFAIDPATKQSEIELPYGMELPTEVKVAEALLSRQATGVKKGDILSVDESGCFDITVISSDGTKSQRYSFTIKIELNTEANIMRLVLDVSGVDYPVSFSGVTGAAVLPKGSPIPSTVVVSDIAISGDATATIAKDQVVTLADNTFTTSITAQNGRVREYSISVVSDPILDGSGNIYKEVIIGDQVWLSPDLHTFKFLDGSDIPQLGEGVAPTGDKPVNVFTQKSDALYREEGNFYTFQTLLDAREICPAGYHVPTREEALRLLTYANNNQGESSLIQAVWTKKHVLDWAEAPEGSPFKDQKYNDKVGFDGIPSGSRNGDGWYENAGGCILYWINNGGYPNQIWFHVQWNMATTPEAALQGWGSWKDGYSVKCIKNTK